MGLDITDNDVYAALTSFIKLIVPVGTPIVRGQQNRVAMPAASCVVMTALGAPRRIGTNIDDLDVVLQGWTADSDTITADSDITTDGVVGGSITGFNALMTADFEYAVQLDFYSAATVPVTNPLAEAWAMAAEILWRDKYAWYGMPDGIKPLYSEDRRQLPLVGAEDQWIARWTITLYLDYQPTLTLPTDAALAVDVVGIPLDIYLEQYPMNWTPLLTEARLNLLTQSGQQFFAEV
jgi:hypothetical protein